MSIVILAARFDHQICSGREFHILAFTSQHSGCTDGRADSSANRRALTAAQQPTDPAPIPVAAPT